MKVQAKQTGFTIVELLIVIVVIGILAAITIVAYNGVQNRAYDTAVQNDLNSFANRLELTKVDSISGSYPVSFTTQTGFKMSKDAYDTSANNVFYCLNTVTDQYALGFTSKSGNSFSYTISNGLQSSATRLRGVETCNLVGISTWRGAGSVGIYGYDQLGGTGWSNWVN